MIYLRVYWFLFKEWCGNVFTKKNGWFGRYNPSQNATSNTITLRLRDCKDSQAQESLYSKQYINVYNYDTEEYDKYEMTDTGCKNVKTGEIVDSPFTQRHLNEMCLQTNLMKSALGENNN